MFKSILLGSALSVALLAAPVMAADFQALAHLQGAALTPLKDAALAAVEGGALCAGPLRCSWPLEYPGRRRVALPSAPYTSTLSR